MQHARWGCYLLHWIKDWSYIWKSETNDIILNYFERVNILFDMKLIGIDGIRETEKY
jgi:hypothetical protein